MFFPFFTLFADNKFLEKKSIDLIQKLTEDNLLNLALLEVDYFFKNFPNSSQKTKIEFQKAKLLTKNMEYKASSKILSIKNPSSDFYQESLFLQAKNYFYLQNFSDSFIFLQNTTTTPKEAQYSRSFYQIAIYLFLENFPLAKQILENAINKELNLQEQDFYQAIQTKPQKYIADLWQGQNFTELEKFLLTLISIELHKKSQNIKQALEDLFIFHLQKNQSPLVLSLLDFFIAKTLYQEAINEVSSDSITLAENFFLKHQQTKFTALPQSYFYLGNIYTKQKKYDLAYSQYRHLLPYVEYTQLENFVLNFVEISQYLEELQIAKELLEKTINNNIQKNNHKIFIEKLIAIYLSLGYCEKAMIYSQTISSLDNSLYPELGHCYFLKKDYQQAKKILLQTLLERNTIAKVSNLLATIFAIEKNEKDFFSYLEKASNDLNGEEFLSLQRSKLVYYHHLGAWTSYQKNFTNLQKNEGFVPSIEEQQKLAESYKKTNQQKKVEELYLKILSQLPSSQEKLEFSKKLVTDYQKKKKYLQIAKVYEVLLKDIVEQNKPKIELLIAKNYLSAKEIPQAQQWFRRVAYRKNIKNYSNYTLLRSESLYYLGEIYSSQKQYKSNIAVLAPELKQITPKNIWYKKLNFSIAGAYSNLQQWNNALKFYKIAAQDKNTKEGKIAHNNILKIQKFLQEQEKNSKKK